MSFNSALVPANAAFEDSREFQGPSVSDTIQTRLAVQPPLEQLSQLLQMIAHASAHHDRAVEIVAEAWDYICVHQLWKAAPDHRYPSLDSLQAELDHQHDLSGKLKAHRTISRRKDGERKTIEARWGAPLEDVISSDLLPDHLGWHMLRNLATLSKGAAADKVQSLLQAAVDHRMSRSGGRKTPRLTPSDVADVMDHQRIHPTRSTLAEPPPPVRTPSNPASPGPLASEDKGTDASEAIGTEFTAPTAAVSSSKSATRADKSSRRSCSCPKTLFNAWESKKFSTGSDEDILAVLNRAHAYGLAWFCRDHLRTLCAALGLKNNPRTKELIPHLDALRTCKDGDLDSFRRREWAWFRQYDRPAIPQDALIIYRFRHRGPALFSFDPQVVLERFAGPGAWRTWQEQGTLTMPRLFAHLRTPDIRHQIDEEFALYRHHEWVPSGKKRMGWMRHMFYSGIQQLVRMDPVWYAINAAGRPDLQWRLISYPYVTKDTVPGESTGFLHLDLNVGRFIQDGSGGNMLSSSVSLDDETPQGCTVVVPGFHKHIRAWHRRVQTRAKLGDGATTNCPSLYRPEDQETWGKPEPQPCPAFGVRLTLPTLIHGSTPLSASRRRTLFAWLTGIDEDHETLYDARASTWSELAACHRDLRIPHREPAGCAPLHRVPDWVFPASLVLDRVSPLAGALVGARRWTDPAVRQERNILLGPDDAQASALAHSIRTRLVEAYVRRWSTLVAAERAAYGKDSYFNAPQTTQHDEDSSDNLSSPPSSMEDFISGEGEEAQEEEDVDGKR